MIGMELDLISEIYIHLLIEKGMRGGISYIAKDIVKQIINTCHVFINTYNHMMLMNQGNLLCISMQITYMVGQCLLYSGFKWLSQQKVDTSSENSPTGYILEIGLKYLDDEL